MIFMWHTISLILYSIHKKKNVSITIDNAFAHSMFDRYPFNTHNIKQLHTYTKETKQDWLEIIVSTVFVHIYVHACRGVSSSFVVIIFRSAIHTWPPLRMSSGSLHLHECNKGNILLKKFMIYMQYNRHRVLIILK